jgi:cytochrome bd ubiquinol oxidase subunit I
VQGLQLTKDGVSPSVGTGSVVTSIVVFFVLYAILAIVCTILMTHYARKQLAPEPEPGVGAGAEAEAEFIY